MMAVAEGAVMEPTISGEAYEKMISSYMDDKMDPEHMNYHKMANAIRFLSMDAV